LKLRTNLYFYLTQTPNIMEILQKNGQRNGAFLATENGTVIGEMTYLWQGNNRFVIDYTGVIDAYKGKGVAKKLVERAVEYARENHCTICPQCGYVRTVFARCPDMGDVLD
jgi:predicted GNAT family acetyltransferase